MATRVEEFAIPIRRPSGTLPRPKNEAEAEEEMTKVTEERIALILERLEDKLDRPVVTSSMTVMDRVWTAAPVILLAATILVGGNTRFLTGEGDLKQEVALLKQGRDNDRDRIRLAERNNVLLDTYNRDLFKFLYDRGVRGVPNPPTLGKEPN